MLLIILELRLQSRKKKYFDPSHPNISLHILLTILDTSHKVLKGNLFNNQETLLAGDHFLNPGGLNVWFRDGCLVILIQSHFDTKSFRYKVVLIQVEVDLLHM